MSSMRRRGETGGGPLPPPDRLLRPSSNKGGVRGKSDQRDNEMKKMIKVIMIRFFVSDQWQGRGGQAPPGVRGGEGEKVWAGGTARSRTESFSQCL